MAKIEFITSDSAVHTAATKQNVPHQHGYFGYNNPMIKISMEVDEKIALEKGFEITAAENVKIPYTLSDSDKENLLLAANFDPIVFLDKVAEAVEAEKQSRAQKELAEQREAEEKQRREFAKKQARELLADEFKVAQYNLDELGNRLKKRDERISKVEGFLRKLILRASDQALLAAGLVESQAEEEGEEELSQEQQEALRTAGLDDC